MKKIITWLKNTLEININVTMKIFITAEYIFFLVMPLVVLGLGAYSGSRFPTMVGSSFTSFGSSVPQGVQP